ncbi:MAG: F0F1 ATP synthase subunit delta [Sulfuricaulis sp.]
MAEIQTLARPYAEAVFSLAQSRQALPAWSEMLAFIAAVAGDATMRRLASDPREPPGRLLDLFLDIGGPRIDAQGANFIRLLVENQRLNLLPEIVAQYEARKTEAEARVAATVVSAFPLETEQLQNLSAALQRKLGRAVNLTLEVDKTLLGGIVIRTGDLVIDGTVRGRLADLATYLI